MSKKNRFNNKLSCSVLVLSLTGFIQPALAINEHIHDQKMQIEHMAVMALANVEDATHISQQSGNWSDPATWGGELPTVGGRVYIGPGHEVVIDGRIQETFMTVRVDGTLHFATHIDTELRVDTLITGENGVFEMGTATNPIAKGVTAKIVIDDYNNGFETADTLSPDYDPFMLGQGIIAHGRFVMHGQEKTGYATINGASMGDTILALDETPADWEVGDRIVIAGTNMDATGDEVRTIAAIDTVGNTVTLDEALANDHHTPPHNKAGLVLKVHVANTTRNARIETVEEKRFVVTGEHQPHPPQPGVEQFFGLRGHVMFMHHNDVDIRYGEFLHMGRTSKRVAVNDTQVDENGNIVAIGFNPRARYPVHFHRSGADGDTPAVVHGSSVFESPGWGYVNHGGYVVMSNNVAYNIDGTSYVSERSDERGAFVGNLSIRNDGPLTHKGRSGPGSGEDHGFAGHGVWTQGPLIFIRNNIVAGAMGPAYGQLHTAIDGLGPTNNSNLFIPKRHAKFPERVHIEELNSGTRPDTLPFAEHIGNMAYGSSHGLLLSHYHPGRSFHHYGEIVDFTAYNVRAGLTKGYSSLVRLTNPTVINDPATPGVYGTENITMIVNPHIEGMMVGISTAATTTNGDISTATGIFGKHVGRYVEGGYLNNLINVLVNGFHGSAPDQGSIRNVTYGEMTPEQVASAAVAFDAMGNHSIARNAFNMSVMEVGATSMADFVPTQQYDVFYLVSYAKGKFNYDKAKPREALAPRRFTTEIDGFAYELMAKREQHADFVPVPSWRFPEAEGYVGPGYDLIRDKTNAELYAMSVADREAMILAVHGEVSTKTDNPAHPDFRKVVFPDWQYVQGGYVLPADWTSNPDYLDGDNYGMGNIVLKKMRDENGNAVAVDWEGSKGGPVTQPDFVEFVPHPWYPQQAPLPIMTLIGNDLDSDWRTLNPNDQTFPVEARWGALNNTPRNNMLFITNKEQPKYGKVYHGTQTYTYFAPDGFTGIDNFRYFVADITGKSRWETAYMFVGMPVDPSLVNFVPEALDDEFTVARGEAAMLDVLANDTDPEGGVLTIEKVGFPERNTDVGKPHFGTAEIVNGQIRYTPNGYFTGTDKFVYYALDDAGNRTRRGTVSVHVRTADFIASNNPPEAVNDNVETEQNNAVTVNVLGNDSDADGDSLSLISATDGMYGTTVVNADGTITYTPAAGFVGNDSFSYTVSDGKGGEASATVGVTISETNNGG